MADAGADVSKYPKPCNNVVKYEYDFQIMSLEWWQKNVMYHIYLQSFKDSNNDGIGDLQGVTSSLHHFDDLNIKTLLLSPFYQSPKRDNGYDISSYVDIDPLYGTLEDFDKLMEEIKKRDMNVIVDLVPNHTSDQHLWFQKSVQKVDPYSDFYVWVDQKPESTEENRLPPNNWLSVFGGSAWTWNEKRKQFYLHQFLPEQPELNLRNPAVIEEIKKAMAFWFEKGVDGFRIDAASHLLEDEQLRDEPKSEETMAKEVYLAKDIHSNKEYAIKVCEKRHILREKKQKAIMREKQIMNILNNHPSPFFIKLYCTFQDTDRLYFVMNYAKHGELLPYIVKVGSFDEECTRFYTAEILLAIEHLHRLNIIHRDLKPENILLDENMHIQITDFGSAKVINSEEDDKSSSEVPRKNSFVGTAQYVSPEMLSDKSASPSVDLWALGCIIYQMVSGLPPFRAPNEYLMFQKITKLEYDFPDGFLPLARDLVEKLLVIEPSQRLGSDDTDSYPSIRNHPFLQGIPWDTLHQRTPPRILPYLPGTSSNEELRSQYQVPDHIEPGLDDKQMTRLLGLALVEPEPEQEGEEEIISSQEEPSSITKSILDITPEEMVQRLDQQAKTNSWHKFVNGNLILKQGLVDKRKGLFARRRMLLLTTGPHLYYVDPQNLVLKGEIPWSPELRPEPKNFKIFFVHTPNRTYYLEDPEGFSLKWCKAIDEVRKATYAQNS